MKVYNESYSVGAGCNRVTTETTQMGTYETGWIVTPLGIVTAYAQGDSRSILFSKLEFFHNGKMHVRNFNGVRYSKRGLARLAKQFAKEIIQSH